MTNPIPWNAARFLSTAESVPTTPYQRGFLTLHEGRVDAGGRVVFVIRDAVRALG
jgi:hypothetical protein